MNEDVSAIGSVAPRRRTGPCDVVLVDVEFSVGISLACGVQRKRDILGAEGSVP